MTLQKELQLLKEHRCEEGCLTIYLNTDQSNHDQQKGEWKIRLKNGLKKLEEYIQVSDDRYLNDYRKIKKRVTNAIHDLQAEMPRSVVVIASADGNWLLKKLQVNVENQFHWEDHPVLDQLYDIQETFPRSGVVLVQKKEVTIIETSLGEVDSEMSYQWDVEDEDWKQYEGLASRDRIASGATHRDQVDQRFEANQTRWYKQLAAIVQKQAKQQDWSKLYLVGPPELLQEFEQHITYKHIDRVKKNFTNVKPHEVVSEVLAS